MSIVNVSEQLVHFNFEVALERVGGDEELLREVAALFLEETAASLDALRRAVKDGNVTAVQHLAHTIKGAASNFGADSTCEAARQLELLGRGGTIDGAAPALAELELAMSVLRPQLAGLASESR